MQKNVDTKTQELREIKLDFEKSQAEMQVRMLPDVAVSYKVQTWFLEPLWIQ